MGRKKPQKTKELLVAIAEASTAATGEETQQQQQPETARKRGRPRKIIKIEETEGEDKKGEPAAEGHAQSQEEVIESEAKKLKTSEEEQQRHVEAEGPSAYTRGKRKETEGKSVEQEPPRRSRRKSEPRKSS